MNELSPALSPSERRTLRAAAHHLRPTVTIAGNGLSANVLKEIDVSLNSHELIKVKLHGIEHGARAVLLTTICANLACAPVQSIGNIFILWRQKPEGKDIPAKPGHRKPAPKTKKQAAALQEKKRH
jgi:putative YhbY family RNA-binding protein